MRLEEEKGVSCNEAIDACEQLLEQKAKLEKDVPNLESRYNSLVAQIKQAASELEQTKRSIAQEEQRLSKIKAEFAKAERELVVVSKTMEREKKLVEKEVAECHRYANVTKEELVTAGEIKAEVEKHGFTLELMLDLSKEFVGYENARDELANNLKEYGSLNKSLEDLADRYDKEKKRVETEISSLESKKKELSSEAENLKYNISQYQSDLDGEHELRRFYRRYAGVSVLVDHLASWNQVFFIRCINPVLETARLFNSNSGNARFWTDKQPAVCPQCGFNNLVYDESIYHALNWQVGTPLKLNLGE
jgi:chromosome segregation ATPase